MVVTTQPDKEDGKMRHYTHLTTTEREKTMVLLNNGFSLRAIALELNRNVSTISRDIARNSKQNGEYSASFADEKYKKRRITCSGKKIFSNPDVAKYVIKRLLLKWTPEEIAERAKVTNYEVTFSYSSIYRAIDSKLLPFSLKKEMRFKGKYKHHKTKEDDKRGKMQNIKSINERPAEVENREVAGHWESDTIHGKRNTGVIGTHVERKTGFLVACKLKSTCSDEFNEATIAAFESIPANMRKTFTVDRGKEFTNHAKLEEALDMQIFFCDPYSPWQRGTNENTNGLLRQFFPKKTSFAVITDQELAHVVDLLNHRPRKRLGWKTPFEAFWNIPIECCT
jgi:IS30 family transposase